MTSSLRNSSDAASGACCLWVDLRRGAGPTLAGKFDSGLGLQTLHDPKLIPSAILARTPRFICFEFDFPHPPGLIALAHTRRHHPRLPVLMLTGFHSEALVLWALRLRVWDVLVNPIADAQLVRHLAALVEATRQPVFAPAFEHELLVPPLPPLPLLLDAMAGRVAAHREGARLRTQAVIDGVAAQFSGRMTLARAAARCRLSWSSWLNTLNRCCFGS